MLWPNKGYEGGRIECERSNFVRMVRLADKSYLNTIKDAAKFSSHFAFHHAVDFLNPLFLPTKMKGPLPSLTQNYHNASYDAISPTRHELSVANQTIIITGGGRGLGPEIAKAYAAAGASHLVLLGRTQSTLSQTAEEIEKSFPSVSVSTHTADVADEIAVGKVAETVGKWDVLILNAGLYGEQHSIENSVPADWWRAFEVAILHLPISSRPPPPTSIHLLAHIYSVAY